LFLAPATEAMAGYLLKKVFGSIRVKPFRSYG